MSLLDALDLPDCRKLILVCGLPASGKTTLVKYLFNNLAFSSLIDQDDYATLQPYPACAGHKQIWMDPITWKPLNPQSTPFTQAMRDFINGQVIRDVADAMVEQYDNVIVTGAYCHDRDRNVLAYLAKCFGYIPVCIHVTTPYALCVERNSRRTELRVPQAAIEDMDWRFEEPHSNASDTHGWDEVISIDLSQDFADLTEGGTHD